MAPISRTKHFLGRIKELRRQLALKTKLIWAQISSFVSIAIKFLRFQVLGIRGSTTPGSDTRRMFMRLCLYLSVCFLVWSLTSVKSKLPEYSVIVSLGAFGLILASLLVFFQIVLLMPFRDNNDDFKLDTWRLVLDTMVSAVFMIVVFALLYRNVGLISDNEIVRPSLLDAIYFSSVTFSTLGYGDFAPHPSARMIAATQALLGNLHLGMIVGANFAAIRR